MDLKWVPIEKLKPNNWNPNFMSNTDYNNLVDNIRTNGYQGQAIIINKEFVIIDGYHRWMALKELGIKEAPCTMDTDADDIKSRILTLRMNKDRGYLVPVETGNLLKSLSKTIPADILTKRTRIPITEQNILMQMNYDPSIEPDRVIDKSILTWQSIDQCVSSLFTQIKAIKFNPFCIATRSRGGLIPARLLADRLDSKEFLIDWDGLYPQNTIFIDDIYDSGETYKEIKKENVTKGNNFIYCVLCMKPANKIDGIYYGMLMDDDKYVVFPWDKYEARRNGKKDDIRK